MGASASKADGQHVMNADHPVRLSQHLLDTLQRSPETDGVRSKEVELAVQRRVRDELRRLDADASKKLADLEDRISQAQQDPVGKGKAGSEDQSKPADLGRETVQKEIDGLRSRLEQRKLRDEVVNDKAVDQAKSSLVECLTKNREKALNCYQEVESFKKEVARLERGFVERTITGTEK